jgi:hypothetical protein
LRSLRFARSHSLAHALLGRDDVDGHERLEQAHAGLPEALAARGAAGDLERHDGRVHVVVSAVDEPGGHAEDGEAGDDALREHGLHALLDAGDVLLGDGAALDLVDELELREGGRGRRGE